MTKTGRPLRFKTPAALEKVITKYLDETPREEWTVTGLCLSCNMTKTLMNDYEKREGFDEVVSIAKLKVENAYELSLRKNGRAGDIFALKNFGWKDKTEQDVNLTGALSVSEILNAPKPKS